MTDADSDGAPAAQASLRLSYLLGIYLAVNAIPDAHVVIDGPDCAFRKAEWVHGRHDLGSTLLDVFGQHRVVTTLTSSERVMKDDGAALATRLRQVAAMAGARAAFVCAMPHVALLGTQYDRILRSLAGELALELIELPSRSLESDWLGGYEETLAAIGQAIDLRGKSPDPGKVAIVGYLMDRTEEDHAANVRELDRLTSAMGLELASVWLSGCPYDALARVGEAATIVALPLGRRAARRIAERTGARLLDLPVPFGAGRTAELLRELGRATGRLERAEALIDAEIGGIARRLEWVVPHALTDTRIAFLGSPDLFGGLLQMARETGMDVAVLAATSDERHVGEDLSAELDGTTLLWNPTMRQVSRAVGDSGVDVLVADSRNCARDHAWARASLEFGFPSHFDHAIFERPYLGFRGFACFVDRLARVVMQTRKRAGSRA